MFIIVPPNALLPGDSAKRWDDFSKGRPPLHLSYPVASPAPAFRCKIDAKYFLTSQNSPPILHLSKSNVLSINSIQSQSGLVGAYLGVESFSNETLKDYKKRETTDQIDQAIKELISIINQFNIYHFQKFKEYLMSIKIKESMWFLLWTITFS